MIIQITLFIILTIACCTVFWKKNKEAFQSIFGNNKSCDDLTGLSRYDCIQCSNAGYCTLPNGEQQCVPGDQNGPYNGQDCILYEYNNITNIFPTNAQYPLIKSPSFLNDMEKSNNKILQLKQQNKITPNKKLFFRHGSPPQEHHKKLY